MYTCHERKNGGTRRWRNRGNLTVAVSERSDVSCVPVFVAVARELEQPAETYTVSTQLQPHTMLLVVSLLVELDLPQNPAILQKGPDM